MVDAVYKNVLEKRRITKWDFPLEFRDVLLHNETNKAFGNRKAFWAVREALILNLPKL